MQISRMIPHATLPPFTLHTTNAIHIVGAKKDQKALSSLVVVVVVVVVVRR